MTVAIDDSPTQRYGRHVEGAGVHHNPTAGPADGAWMYGHNWVSRCFLATHSLWGVIALPWRSLLSVREKDVPALEGKYGWKFRTKQSCRTCLSCGRLGIDDGSMSRFDGAARIQNVPGDIASCERRHPRGDCALRRWRLNQWMYTLVELCSWDVPKPRLTDRSHRPWDNPDRRPSHADRRSTIAREMLGKQFPATLPGTLNLRKFRALIKDVISLCT